MKCCSIVRRSHFLLLEILIAFGLVALCIFPLVSSQVKILTAEKQLQQKLQDQRDANALFAAIVEKLYKKEMGLENEAIELAGGFRAVFEVERKNGSESCYLVLLTLKKGSQEFKYPFFCEKEGLI